MTASGAAAEERAATFLARNGLKVIERNYRCRFGEIDLVARERDCLVFVEVRYRASRDFGSAAESITVAKRRKLVLAAKHYLSGHGTSAQCRFDAVLLNGDTDSIEWIRDAFGE